MNADPVITSIDEHHRAEEKFQQRLKEKEGEIDDLAEELLTTYISKMDDWAVEAMGPDNLNIADYKRIGAFVNDARSPGTSDIDRIKVEAALGRFLINRWSEYMLPYCIEQAKRRLL